MVVDLASISVLFDERDASTLKWSMIIRLSTPARPKPSLFRESFLAADCHSYLQFSRDALAVESTMFPSLWQRHSNRC